MPSPYPGIDPTIEQQGHWPNFHGGFMFVCQEALLATLPPNYDARMEDRVSLSERKGRERQAQREADVDVINLSGHGVGTATAVAVEIEADQATATALDLRGTPRKQRFIRIISRSGDEVVTVLELLSPANKFGKGYRDFRKRHDDLLDAGANVVEIDLLRRGRRSPAADAAPGRDGYAIITKAEDPDRADVWAFTLNDRLPRIPVPLKPEDGHVVLDVGAVYRDTYDRGGFSRRLKYEEKPAAKLD